MDAPRRLAEGLWILDLPHSLMGVQVGARSTIVRLDSGGLWILSPGPFGPEQRSAIAELGPVAALVAPNTYHHVYLEQAHEQFPEAQVFLAPGLSEKISRLPEGVTLGDEPPPLWSGVLDQLRLHGTDTNETVFLHLPSRTLVLTDLAFNLRRGGLWTRLAMRLNGGFGRFGPTKVMEGTIHDRAAFSRSLQQLLAWDFDRVIVAHGDVLESGGQEAMRKSFAAYLKTG